MLQSDGVRVFVIWSLTFRLLNYHQNDLVIDNPN
jgi:hypothetical protein